MRYSVLLSVIVVGMFVTVGCSGRRPYNKDPAFDFSDDFYLENGINPDAIVDRLAAQDRRSVADASPHPDYTDVRILELTGGFDREGRVLYYTVHGKIMPNTFTNDGAGQAAMDLANSSRVFIFPKALGNPLGTDPPNRRQDNLFDIRKGYFRSNPLGNWILVFVRYTEKALNTEAGQGELADLAKKNGLDLNGTPVIKTVSDLENLEKNGLVELRTRAMSGSQGAPWVI